MSQFLSKLKTIKAERVAPTVDPVQAARDKLCEAIDQQVACVQAMIAGNERPTKPVTKYRDGENGRERYEEQVKIRPWYWGDGERWFIEPRYGNKPLLADGMAIEVGARNKLAPALATLKKAVEAGEVDQQLAKARQRKKK